MPMACAGTGIAPFRGFIQERVLQISSGGRNLAPALLFMGCKSPDVDALHSEELEESQKLGAVDVRYAFSRATDHSGGCKHVQDRLWKDRADIAELFHKGAKINVCGSSAVGEEVKSVAKGIFVEAVEGPKSEAEADAWLEDVKRERYYSDSFT